MWQLTFLLTNLSCTSWKKLSICVNMFCMLLNCEWRAADPKWTGCPINIKPLFTEKHFSLKSYLEKLTKKSSTYKNKQILDVCRRLLSMSFQCCRYCDQLKLSESTHVLQPFLPSILEGLVQLAAQFSSEVLTLVMETLCIVCTVDPAFTTSAENKICPLTIAIFLKYNNGTDTTPLTTSSVRLLLCIYTVLLTFLFLFLSLLLYLLSFNG